MKTYGKHRYYHGMNFDLLEPGEYPNPVGYWTANTPALSNMLTQLNLDGEYTFEEEQREIQVEN